MFDTDSFLNTTTEAALDTVVKQIEPGEYPAVIEKLDTATYDIKKGERAGQKGQRLIVTWHIQDPAVEADLGRKPTIMQNIFLDLTEDGNGLDMSEGRNVGLGKLRDAVGQNQPGKKWSPSMLIGSMATVLISTRMVDDNEYAEVKRVASA